MQKFFRNRTLIGWVVGIVIAGTVFAYVPLLFLPPPAEVPAPQAAEPAASPTLPPDWAATTSSPSSTPPAVPPAYPGPLLPR